MLLYYLDLAGVAVFAASGVLATRDRELDIFGVVIVATFTAIGGGTLRDLLLAHHPIFWVVDPWYLVTILLSVLATVLYLSLRPPPGFLFLVADACGLAIFALSGAKLALEAGHSPLIVIIMGAMTGVMGGMLRDVITARIPLVMRKEVYATAAISGIVVYLVLHALSVPETLAFAIGVAVVIGLRLVAIRWGLNLPSLPWHGP
ncbi:trimeric intracellular cation channel family protein [Aquisalimonas lutea]|uniref:trimeric intracellular cation channel family protein n=1 Tax=Aquisalimonas lutea TaxID=1327750 RepID=UPI0025B4585A|nr:trimeric intracellular cation channel family protein [Aquisalimonas lutea]MDN3519869.1 trimeric intracellular cation channel family protein [Aquisalimonas lutea]